MSNGVHISPKTGKVVECKATKRPCRYKNYATREEAEKAVAKNAKQAAKASQKAVNKAVNGTLPPVIVPPADFRHANKVNPSLTYVGGLDYEYDGYGHTDSCSAPEDDYCRDQVYFNLHITPGAVDHQATLRAYFGMKQKTPIPADLDALAVSLGMDDAETAYETVAEWGYYGEEAKVQVKEEVRQALDDWYYSKPNAEDADGILDYVRSKGTATAGLRPLEALKKQLASENKGKNHPAVENARYLFVTKVAVDKVQVPNPNYYNTIQQRPVESKTNGKKIAGVLHLSNYSNVVLVDGYHRYKELRKKRRGKGEYIVISESDYGPYGPSWLGYRR